MLRKPLSLSGAEDFGGSCFSRCLLLLGETGGEENVNVRDVLLLLVAQILVSKCGLQM